MNEDTLKGNWKKMKGKIREKWADLTDDDIDRIDGNREQLQGTLQEKYGRSKDEARQEVDQFLESNRRGTH